MMPDRSRETYLLETSIHDSDLLARKLGLPQKFLYRHRPGSLLPRSRALEFEERFFRSRRVRRRCHDLRSCRRLNCRKPTTSCLLSPFQLPSILFMSDGSRGHTIAGTFPVIVRLIVRFLSIDPPSRLAQLLSLDLASIDGGAKLSNGGTAKYFPHVTTLVAPRATRSTFGRQRARCNAKRDIFNVPITSDALIDYIDISCDRIINSVFTTERTIAACVYKNNEIKCEIKCFMES